MLFVFLIVASLAVVALFFFLFRVVRVISLFESFSWEDALWEEGGAGVSQRACCFLGKTVRV
jgi:hypothetical protein